MGIRRITDILPTGNSNSTKSVPFRKAKCVTSPLEMSSQSALEPSAQGTISPFGIEHQEFKPATTYNEFKAQLQRAVDKDGKQLFGTQDIEAILNAENNITEQSKILHELQFKKIDLGAYSTKQLICEEGITFNIFKERLDFTELLKNSKMPEKLRNCLFNNTYNYSCLLTDKDIVIIKDVKELEKKLSILTDIEKYCPDLYKKLKTNHLNSILGTEISSGTIKEIMEIAHKKREALDIHDINNLLRKGKDNIESKVRFIKEIMAEPRLNNAAERISLTSIMADSDYEKYKNFSLKNNPEIIDLIEYIEKDEKLAPILKHYFATESILLKQGLTFEKGREFINLYADSKECLNLCATDFQQWFNKLDPNFSDVETISKLFKNKVAAECLKREVFFKLTDINIAKEWKDDVKYLLERFEGHDLISNLLDWDIPNTYSQSTYEEAVKFGRESELRLNREKIDAALKKVDEIRAKVDSKTFKTIQYNLKNDVLQGEITLKHIDSEFIKYMKELEAETGTDFINYDVLKKTCNIKQLRKNKPFFLKLLELDKKSRNSEFKTKINQKFMFFSSTFASYDGDLEKIYHEVESIMKLKNSECIQPNIIEETGEVRISYQIVDKATSRKNYTRIFSKDMNLLSETMETTVNKNGIPRKLKTIIDHKTNQTHTITYRSQNGYDVMSEVVSAHRDKNGKLIKTVKIKESSVPGVFEIREITPDGKIKVISSAKNDAKGLRIRKDLESLDGTKSKIRYRQLPNGNEEFLYRITAKSGKELACIKRNKHIIDANTYETSINGKKFKVHFTDAIIEILDCSKNKTKIIDLATLNPNSDERLIEILKTMSGDELWHFGERIKKINFVDRIESAIDPATGELYCGPHKFIIEHELGHGKDGLTTSIEDVMKNATRENLSDFRTLSGKKGIRRIYTAERDLAMKHLHPEFTAEAAYFWDISEHYAGRWGGLGEAIAETNALKTTARFHPLLGMRSHLLQQYMPKLIALLFKHHL